MKAIHGISGKTADAFDEHQIDLPGVAVRNQPLELHLMCGTCACDTFICVHAGVFPCEIFLDETAVVTDLRRKSVVKCVHRDTGVSSHTQLFLQGRVWLNSSYLHVDSSFPTPTFLYYPHDSKSISENKSPMTGRYFSRIFASNLRYSSSDKSPLCSIFHEAHITI